MKTSALLLLLTATATATSAPATPAAAVGVDAIAQARARSRLAAAHYRAGNYDDALPEYEAAARLDPRPEFLFNQAQCHRQLGHRLAAIAFYERFLAASSEGAAADEARRHVATLTAQLRRLPPPPEPTVPPEAASSPPDDEKTVVVIAPVAAPPRPVPLSRRPWFWGLLGGGTVTVAGVAVGVAAGTIERDPDASLGHVVMGATWR